MSGSAAKTRPRIGAHTSIAGSLERAAEKAFELGCDAFQIFSSSPRMWRAAKLDEGAVSRFRNARERYGLGPLLIHGNYLVNMASTDRVIRRKSKRAFRAELERAAIVGADYVVIHPGSHKGQTLGEAIRVLSDSIAQASKGFPWDGVELLLENTAGSGQTIGRDFDELAEIKAQVQDKASIPIGFCIDTAHCLAAGFDISTETGFKQTLRKIDKAIGIHNVRAVHANDSKTPLGSRLDRHEHIGRGTIGRDGFRRMLHHPKLRRLPFILETPNDEHGGYEMDVAELKTLLKRRPRIRRARKPAGAARASR